jgi:DNA-binding SARP family transcriptional activator
MECWSGERPVEISGTLQRTLLATLLVGAGGPVSVTALVRELWADTPPPKWENALQAHISRLRRRLLAIAGHHRPARLLALTSGYTLLVDNSAVDGAVFMRGVALAREMAAREPAAAVNALRTVLSMWRGPAFGLVACGPMCRAAAQRYEATRLSGLEMLFDLELQIGRHADIIPALSELVESPDLNERFCEQLMVALYRSGRQSEALVTYRRMRQRLGDELGIQPTITFRNHEQAILVQDPALHVGANHAVLRSMTRISPAAMPRIPSVRLGSSMRGERPRVGAAL